MNRRSLIQQLDEAIQALIARRGLALPQAEPELAGLARLAEGLIDLPRESFKQRLKTDLERRSKMAGTANAIPETRKVQPIPEGYHTATPYLFIRGAARAIEFYKQAFGATELLRLQQPDGRIGHAEIKIGNSPIMLADEVPEMGYRSPQSLGGSSASILLYVEDVDALASQAIAAGAKVLRPVEDQFYGDRTGTFADPFGHFWSIATRTEDIPPEEMQRRAEAFMRQQAAKADSKQGAAKTVKPIPEGFHTVTPYITVKGAAQMIDFVKQAFGATELMRTTVSAGGLHAEVRIGDSMLMMGGSEQMTHPEMPTALHFFVPDTDAIYQGALQAGATSIQEPSDQDYGERVGAVKDPFGNEWYIATNKGEHYIPEGLRTVNVYLHPRGTDRLIDFLKEALGAEVVARYAGPDGSVVHAKVRMGDSVIEMGEAHGPYQPMPTMLYLYVEDVDALYQRAVQAGGIGVQAPAEQPYGDRTAQVKDAFGNSWYLATHVKDVAM